MALPKKIVDRNWYIISYRGIHSNLVGGQRCARLYDFLQQKERAVQLITPVGNAADANQLKIASPIKSHGFLSRLIRALSPVDETLLWAFRVKNNLKKKEKSIIFTSLPPFGVCYTGLLLKKSNREHFWIADFRDSWTTSYIHKPFLYRYKMFFAFYFERKLFKNADLILLNSDTDCLDYTKKYPFAKDKCITIRNGYDYKKRNYFKDIDLKNIRFIYAGGIYQKGLAAFGIVNFLEKINQPGKRFHCDFYGEYHPILDQSPFITYKGKFEKKELIGFLCKYKIGLIFQQEEDMNGGRINQKFYDYLGCGLQPIVINPSPEIEKQMRYLSIGVSIKPDFDPFKIIEDIERTYTTDLQISNEDLVPYSRAFQFEKLYQYLSNNQMSVPL